MKIKLNNLFLSALKDIKEFIALDSSFNAQKFNDDVFTKIETLSFMPKKCRKSVISSDENVRDLIFKGYVITFRISQDCIEVLYIFKENEPKFRF